MHTIYNIQSLNRFLRHLRVSGILYSYSVTKWNYLFYIKINVKLHFSLLYWQLQFKMAYDTLLFPNNKK